MIDHRDSKRPNPPKSPAFRPMADGGEAAEMLNMVEDCWLPLSRTDKQYMGVSSAAARTSSPRRSRRASFKAMLNSPKRTRRGGKMPLVG